MRQAQRTKSKEPPKEEKRRDPARGQGEPEKIGPPRPPSPEPAAPQLTPKPLFSCSFWAKIQSDKTRPQVTGLCPFGPNELLEPEAEEVLSAGRVQRHYLSARQRGTIQCGCCGHQSGLHCWVSEGGLLWQKALLLGQASHAVTAVGSDRLAVSVAGQLEVYNLEGKLVEKVVPPNSQQRGLVFLARQRGGFVASDWYRRSVVLLSQEGEQLAEWQGEQLRGCQPGSVCANSVGVVYVVLRELNQVVAFSERGESLGPFLTAENSIDRPRVVTVATGRRFAVALSNGTVHIFKIRYQSQ